MSAWIVTKGHIDCLVQALINEGIILRGQADRAGQALWQENHNSVNFRYREDTECPEYHFEGTDQPLDDIVVWRQLDCFDYQTCEHPEWHDHTNWARSLHDRLEGKYRIRYGGGSDDSSHTVADRLRRESIHRPLPWGINDISEAVVTEDTFVEGVS
jgi:hypothetical protein